MKYAVGSDWDTFFLIHDQLVWYTQDICINLMLGIHKRHVYLDIAIEEQPRWCLLRRELFIEPLKCQARCIISNQCREMQMIHRSTVREGDIPRHLVRKVISFLTRPDDDKRRSAKTPQSIRQPLSQLN